MLMFSQMLVVKKVYIFSFFPVYSFLSPRYDFEIQKSINPKIIVNFQRQRLYLVAVSQPYWQTRTDIG